MSRLGDCLTAGPSIESARRGIRLRSQMARSEQDMPPRGLLLCRRAVWWVHTQTGVPGYPTPPDCQYKQISAQPVESAGKDRPAGAESTRAPGTITKTAIVPMAPEGAGSQKDFASRVDTHGAEVRSSSWLHHIMDQEPRQQASGAYALLRRVKGRFEMGWAPAEGRTKTTCHPRELAGRGWWRQLRPRNRLSSRESLE